LPRRAAKNSQEQPAILLFFDCELQIKLKFRNTERSEILCNDLFRDFLVAMNL